MIERPANVRIAGEADEDALYDLLLGLERDNSLGFAHDEDEVRAHIRLGTQKNGGMHGVIDAPNGVIAASVGLVMNKFWYSKQFYWHELWLFVRLEYRKGTGYSDDLMAWVQYIKALFALESGHEVPFFTSVTSRKRFEAKRRWWARRGEQIGAIFLIR
jgi:hypothetical protein